MFCWASHLGGCDSASREHLISQGMWDDPAIHVIGFEWCKTKPIKVGMASLTAKILCRAHNSALSPVDQGGIDVFRAITEMAAEIDQRLLDPRGIWTLRRKTVSGGLLERWMLKTLINVALTGRRLPAWPGGGGTNPPKELVEAAFGIQPLQPPLGLYIPANRGDKVDLQDRIEVTTLFADDGVLVGAIFGFAGLEFVLAIDKAIPDKVKLHGVSALYRLTRLNHLVNSRPSHELTLEW